ncbi:SprT-like domain-containing protein [Pseudomonas cedrina]|uniref:SprT-like domain-containing protein n=1 Tax=Pseudomonas cedrina TaxID=651740 RepID=UPI003ED9CB0C
MLLPTQDAYGELDQAYTHFNTELFGGQLPACLITLQREKKSYGYFSAERFINQGDKSFTDEIALNPAYFGVVPLKEVMQTVVREMVRLWQHHFGKPGRRRYHNREWAEKMKSIGLMPSDTGYPGGKQTGEKMSCYPIPEGPFELAFAKLLETSFRITWFDRNPSRHVAAHTLQAALEGDVEGVDPDNIVVPEETPETSSKPTRAKYTCAPCKINIWGKPGLNLICGECSGKFTTGETTDDDAEKSRNESGSEE